jgi:ATP-dependent Clp protease ATP-binding subunit ClpX
MIIFPLITTWMWFEVAMAVQSLATNASNFAWTSSARRTSPRWRDGIRTPKEICKVLDDY